jgi:ribosomal protein L15E
LDYCFGAPAPEGTMVQRCRDVSDDNVNDLIKEFDIPYAHIKPKVTNLDKLTEESKARISGYEAKLDTVIW